MSAEIAHLKMNLNEKIKQEEDLQRALEDSAVLESSLRGELEEYQQRVEDKKVELQQLQVCICNEKACRQSFPRRNVFRAYWFFTHSLPIRLLNQPTDMSF